MNKRCIVTVATGDFYMKQQDRLIQSAKPFIDGEYYYDQWDGGRNEAHEYQGLNIDLMAWKGIFPTMSPKHEESPYAFKLHAIRDARDSMREYTTILWCDSPAGIIRNPLPIFEKIEKQGYYAMSHHDPLENWVGDTALKRFGMTRDQLKGFHLPSGSCYGFDLSQAWVRRLFDLFCQYEEEGLFKSEVIGPDKWHRHDEAILALILIQHSLPVFFNDPLFQSDSPECVIRSGANWTQDAKVYGE